ncbi:hypothetical protein [Klebsiella phage 05F01]|nr:hypothetical protein [Klebsiella phage 05F01]
MQSFFLKKSFYLTSIYMFRIFIPSDKHHITMKIRRKSRIVNK